MSTQVIEKYKTVNPLNDEKTTDAMLRILVEVPRERLGEFFAGDQVAGRMYLYRHEAFPGKVIEYVPGLPGDDSVTTLYDEHPIFESRQRLIDVRRELIGAIESLLMAVPNATVVRDNGRERDVYLQELGTAQLLDTLVHFNGTSPLILRA
jgi:hypothetical protein